MAEPQRVPITTPFIKLDSFLKFCGAAETGGHAKEMVLAGEVLVDGQACIQRGRKLVPGMTVTAGGESYLVAADHP